MGGSHRKSDHTISKNSSDPFEIEKNNWEQGKAYYLGAIADLWLEAEWISIGATLVEVDNETAPGTFRIRSTDEAML